MQPHRLPVQLLWHMVSGLEPIVAVLAIPVHVLAVKILPCRRVRLGFLRTDEVALLILPVVNLKLLLHL